MSELLNNREQRIRQLKEIILHLHQGRPADEVRAQLGELVREVDATEVAAMEEQLMAEGMSVDEVRSMCDLHAQVLGDMVQTVQIKIPLAPGHPVDTFRRENEAILLAVRDARQAFAALLEGPQDSLPSDEALDACRASVNALFDVERHYRRKEDLLFPQLEKHGVLGPSKVMWAKDDEARGLVRDLAAALKESGVTTGEWRLVLGTVGEQALEAVAEMVSKEEKILLPMALDTLTREEWGLIWQESPRLGWCLVEPRQGYRPPEGVVPENPVNVPGDRPVALPTGFLTLPQLESLFQALPVDLTFVDADDRVAFFSEGPSRVFSRSRAILGRKVQHCHPPRSMDVVERILQDFRSGRHDVAEFWINFQGRFVHIRYFALRGPEGEYRGCLEVTQDATALRALQGERRLLQYDEPAGAAKP